MAFWQLLLFIPACFALNMAPGPNNLLSLNNARCYGFRSALFAGFGRIAAFSVMIALVASGLAVILFASETVFFAIKLAGAGYLLWLAITLWRSEASPVAEVSSGKSLLWLARQEFMLAAGNPKAILIFTAFFPQFVDNTGSVSTQFFTLGATFLVLELGAIAIYALFGIYLRQWFCKPSRVRRFNQACATFLAVSGLNLLFSKQS
ncbi:LysE family translocator [Pseudoalteromonas rubra]|uniref:LysE family translocator n=1 Tax=Pseudoalteromonas rubra TaxID=43658 RepID=UPI000F78E4C4|nr:LysE family translocator [Pseudoalteromonas rubra]